MHLIHSVRYKMCSLRRITDAGATLGGTLPSASSFAPRFNRLYRFPPPLIAGLCFAAALLLLQAALWNRTAELRALRQDAGALVLALVTQEQQRTQQAVSGERTGPRHRGAVELAEGTGEREDHYHGGQGGQFPPLAVLLAQPQLLLRTVCRGDVDGRAQPPAAAGYSRHGGRRAAALSVLPDTASAGPRAGLPTALEKLCKQAQASVSAAAGGRRAPADAAAAHVDAIVVAGVKSGTRITPGGVGAKSVTEAGGSVSASSASWASAAPGEPSVFVGIFVGAGVTSTVHTP